MLPDPLLRLYVIQRCFLSGLDRVDIRLSGPKNPRPVMVLWSPPLNKQRELKRPMEIPLPKGVSSPSSIVRNWPLVSNRLDDSSTNSSDRLLSCIALTQMQLLDFPVG